MQLGQLSLHAELPGLIPLNIVCQPDAVLIGVVDEKVVVNASGMLPGAQLKLSAGLKQGWLMIITHFLGVLPIWAIFVHFSTKNFADSEASLKEAT